MFCKKRCFLEISQNSQENTCARVSFSINLLPQPLKSILLDTLSGWFSEAVARTCNCNKIKKENLIQVFSCEFCDISKNIFFTEHLRVIASEYMASFCYVPNSEVINCCCIPVNVFCEIFRKNFMWKRHLSITNKKESLLKRMWIWNLKFKICYLPIYLYGICQLVSVS